MLLVEEAKMKKVLDEAGLCLKMAQHRDVLPDPAIETWEDCCASLCGTCGSCLSGCFGGTRFLTCLKRTVSAFHAGLDLVPFSYPLGRRDPTNDGSEGQGDSGGE